MKGRIFFENQSFSFADFATITLPKNLDWALNTQLFVNNWLNGQDSFELNTSGSTGQPKTIQIQKSQMLASALATIDFLKIKQGSTALLCMNPDMIGGRMMLVRAMVGDWNLHVVKPSSTPIIHRDIDFAAMVPLQVETLFGSENGQDFLNRIDKLIIGGAGISETLINKIHTLNTRAYQTFGMTETVSHIALRNINGANKAEDYQLIGDNEIKVDPDGRLSIKGTVTNGQWIKTNDLVEKTSSGFIWLGRADLTVNTGGIKVQIEDLERELSNHFNTKIWVWKETDVRLGESLVGMTENMQLISQIESDYPLLKNKFKKYHLPKKWVLIKNWHQTPSGKPDRSKTLNSNR